MKTSLNYLHHQATDWLRELEFYKLETGIFEQRLGLVVKANTASEILAQVEHFQNRFIMYKEQIDELHHEIGLRVKELESLAASRPEHIDEKFTSGSDKLYHALQSFVSGFLDNKKEFNTFLSKVL